METIKLKALILSSILLIATAGLYSQNLFKLLSESSSLQIAGTSSIHDWEMEASNFHSEALLQIDPGNSISVNLVEFICPVAGISSGNKIMDNKTYKALKEEQYPEINFSVNPQKNVRLSNNNGVVNGILTIAGVTKEAVFPCNLAFITADRFKISGKVPLKMSDFNIKPPTAMMGALKSGDEVVVKFNFEFNLSSQELTKYE